MVVKESGSALALAIGLERGALQQRLSMLKCGVLAHQAGCGGREPMQQLHHAGVLQLQAGQGVVRRAGGRRLHDGHVTMAGLGLFE